MKSFAQTQRRNNFQTNNNEFYYYFTPKSNIQRVGRNDKGVVRTTSRLSDCRFNNNVRSRTGKKIESHIFHLDILLKNLIIKMRRIINLIKKTKFDFSRCCMCRRLLFFQWKSFFPLFCSVIFHSINPMSVMMVCRQKRYEFIFQ